MDETQGECGSINFSDGDGLGETPTKDKSKQRDARIHKQQTPKPKPVNQAILDDWQKEAEEHEGNLLLCTGRQVGKTFIMSRKAAKYMIAHPGSKIICCSLTEDQAQLIIVMTLDYLEKNAKNWIAKGNKKPTKNKIELTNHSSILARPVGTTGDAVRGFTGDVLILDECSRFAEFIFTASMPTLLTTGGKIWMCSTPFGKRGYFYEVYKTNKDNPNGRYKVIETNSWDVVHNRKISDVWTEDKRKSVIEFIEQEQKDKSPLMFAQEYLGKFIEELQQFFKEEWLNKVLTLKRRTTPILQGKQYYLGVDIARMGEDQSTFEILDKINDTTIEHIENITTKKTLTTQTYDKIIELDKLYNFQKIGIDAGTGSLGVGIFDFLLRSPIGKKVIPLSNLARDLDRRGEKKKSMAGEDMYQEVLIMGEMGILKLLDEEDVRLSLQSVQYEYTTDDNSASKVKIWGNFTHIAEGIKRAAVLANTKSLNHRIYWI